MSEHEDNELPRRMAAGDESALAELYDRFGGPVYALSLRIIGNPRDAEEIVQDTFRTAWTKAAQFNPNRSGTFTWLVMMARNKSIDRVRSIRRRLPEPPGDERRSVRETEVRRTPADEAEADERAATVALSVESLPPTQRQAIELAFFEGLTHPEIAERLGESIGTVKSRIRLGMEKLRARLRRTRP